MRKEKMFISLLVTILASAIIWSCAAQAQTNQGKGVSAADVAYGGLCPVCLIGGMKMSGNDHFVTEYEGKVYKFYDFGMQKAFIENPEQYVKKEIPNKNARQ